MHVSFGNADVVEVPSFVPKRVRLYKVEHPEKQQPRVQCEGYSQEDCSVDEATAYWKAAQLRKMVAEDEDLGPYAVWYEGGVSIMPILNSITNDDESCFLAPGRDAWRWRRSKDDPSVFNDVRSIPFRNHFNFPLARAQPTDTPLDRG